MDSFLWKRIMFSRNSFKDVRNYEKKNGLNTEKYGKIPNKVKFIDQVEN